MGALISSFTAWLYGIFGSLLTFAVNHFLATKIIFATLFIVILPVVINNLIYALLDEILNYVNSYSADLQAGSIEGFFYNFVGLSGWFAERLNIPDIFSVLMSAVSIKFALRLIPFIRL